LWGQPVVRAVAVGFCAVVACVAVDDVALVFLGRETLKASSAAASALYAGSGLGLLAGFALLARWARRTRPAALLLLGFGVMSAGNLLTRLAPAVAAALATQAVR